MHGFPGAVLMSPQLPEERGHIWTEHVKKVKSWGGALKHRSIKVYMYMNNLMADCGLEEYIKFLCSSLLMHWG